MDAILIVDDEALVRQVLSDALAYLGFTPLLAADCYQAMSVLSRHPETKIVILDVNLPYVDGHRCFHQLIDVAAHLQFIMISGDDQIVIDHMVVDDQVAGFIQKPFDLRQLDMTIRTLLA